MIAPIEQSSTASSSSKGGLPASGPFVLRKVAQRFSPAQWLALAAGILIVSTGLLVVQHPWRNFKNSVAHVPRSWWLEAIEWNRVPGLPTIPANWPAPNLLAIDIESKTATVHASDGRLFTSSDAGEHWEGTLPSVANFNPLITVKGNQRTFGYKYADGTNAVSPQVTREGALYFSGDNKFQVFTADPPGTIQFVGSGEREPIDLRKTRTSRKANGS